MGADNVVAYVGIRFLAHPKNDDELEDFGSRSDTRVRAAREVGLRTYCGRLTDGDYHFLLIGTELGDFGVQGKTYKGFRMEELSALFAQTQEKLVKAGFKEEPAIHIQLQGQY